MYARARVCAAVLGGTLRLSQCFTASNSCAREAWLVCTDRPAVKRTNTSTALFVALEPSTVKAACWRICTVWAVGARAHRQYPEVVAGGSTEIRSVYWQVVSCADVARVHCKPIEIGRALFGCIQPPRCGYLAVMKPLLQWRVVIFVICVSGDISPLNMRALQIDFSFTKRPPPTPLPLVLFYSAVAFAWHF